MSSSNFLIINFLCCFLIFLSPVYGSGFFHLQFIEGIRSGTETTVHVCLKEFWNSQINFNRCTFGQRTILVNNHHHADQMGNSGRSDIRIPFSFRWIGSFSFTIQLSEPSSSQSSINRFIVEDEFAVPDGSRWKLRTFQANDGRIITIRFRIACDQYYHRDDCATFCRSRNDSFGHYSCDEKSGAKQCLSGWKGENCDKPKCRDGCNEAHGFCETPGECTCRSGWKGQNCDECVPYPGCLHGYCVSPFQCICHRNWGGILCDQDLNYCGTHEPCLNDGRCENIAPDNYRCVCKKGFSGVNCQKVVDACATSPCLHSGSCITLSNGTDFRCQCKNGFYGKRCENDLNECVSQPCLNGGTCHDLENDYRCTCPSGWTGNRCEQDVDECSALVTPCIKASACININGSYICVCEKGYEGVFCETEVDDCKHNKINCHNGGFCIDLVNDFRCVCATGFTGPRCDRIDESVCDHLPNHVWRLNETDDCEKICLCQPNSTKVACKCQEESKCDLKTSQNGENVLLPGENRSEIKVVFDSQATMHSCNTIHSIHSLLLNTTMDDDYGGEFCCHIRDESTNEVLIQVHKNSLLAQYISRTIFPHILHVIVNTQNIQTGSDWSLLNLLILALFSLISVGAVLGTKSYLKRRQQEVDAGKVVIHCIQNNLKSSSNGLEFRPLTPPHKKLANNNIVFRLPEQSSEPHSPTHHHQQHSPYKFKIATFD